MLCVIKIVIILLCTWVAMLSLRTGNGTEVYLLGVTAESPLMTVKCSVKIVFFLSSLDRITVDRFTLDCF